MRFMLRASVVALTFVAGSQVALADCDPGQVPSSCGPHNTTATCCRPAGTRDCGGGEFCESYELCGKERGRRVCVARESGQSDIDRRAEQRMLREADEYNQEDQAARNRAAAEALGQGLRILQQQQQQQQYQQRQHIPAPQYRQPGPLTPQGNTSCPPNYPGCGRR